MPSFSSPSCNTSIPSDDCDRLYFQDPHIHSYTPTLSALIESRKSSSSCSAARNPPWIMGRNRRPWIASDNSRIGKCVAQYRSSEPQRSPIRSFCVTRLTGDRKLFGASFRLHGVNLTLLEIVRSQLPAAELAFLSHGRPDKRQH